MAYNHQIVQNNRKCNKHMTFEEILHADLQLDDVLSQALKDKVIQ